MGCPVQLGLFRNRQPENVVGVKRVVASQVLPKGHAAHIRLRNLDCLEPNPDLVRVQTAEPFAWRPAMARSTLGLGQLWIMLSAPLGNGMRVAVLGALSHLG